jgi:hypothetical protein
VAADAGKAVMASRAASIPMKSVFMVFPDLGFVY